MVNYISTLKSVKNLPEVKSNDKIIIVAKKDESLKVEDLDTLLKLNGLTNNNINLSIYTVKDEFQLAVGAPILQNPDEEFVLADSSLPTFPMFGDRVKKLSTRKTTTRKPRAKSAVKKGSKTSKKVETQEREDSPVVESKSVVNKVEVVPTPEDKSTTKTKELKEIKKTKAEKEETRSELARELDELLHLDPDALDFPMGKDVLHLIVAQIYEQATNDEEAKNKILKQNNGELLWEVVEPHVEAVKALVTKYS